MQLTATHINYYFICHRKLWLFGNGINMEHTSDVVYEGKLIGETTYPQRAEKYTEVALSCSLGDGCEGTGKIDFYDAKNRVVHEIKKSNKAEIAHEWQVKFYIWLLNKSGIEGATGILEYPKLRETKQVVLAPPDEAYLQSVMTSVKSVLERPCPPVIHAKLCKSCSYYDFCYVDES